MLVVFVHGWGVRGADYGPLPRFLQSRQPTIEVWLSDYISYDNDVTLDDLAAAFERARQEHFPDQPFACVTHSTGGPVVRAWAKTYSGTLTHLVMLAPPNHGSALAQLGKGRLSRMHFWTRGMEPGEKVLDWLELGSEGTRRLLAPLHHVYEFVLTGAAIDKKLYDHLNSYTGEWGSDGVVRAAAANLNGNFIELRQGESGELAPVGLGRQENVAFGILPNVSHCGDKMGILYSDEAARWVKRCLSVSSSADYSALSAELATLTAGEKRRCSMIVFRVVDCTGAAVNDFDILLTSGCDYSPDRLPRGFFIDRQRNSRTGNSIAYFLNHTAMSQARELGFRVAARPDAGPVRFAPAEFRSDLATVETVLRAHETVHIDITLERLRDPKVFALKRCE